MAKSSASMSRPSWPPLRSSPATRVGRWMLTGTTCGAFFQWAADEGLVILSATRLQVELYVRAMERRGLAATTIDRRLSTVCGFYRFAHIDGRIASNPAQYVRRPKVHPNDARGLDRSELGSLLFAAERVDQAHAALAVLLGLNGLRVSEACSADIENLGSERGHRTLRIVGKGNKPAVIPLVPRTARTIDLAIGERTAGPILLRHDGSRLDRRTAHRWVRSVAKRAGLGHVHPHILRAASSCAPSRRGSRCAKCRSPPVTPTPGRRRSTTTAARASTGMRRTSWSPSWRVDDAPAR